MPFITQAGVGLGLATIVAHEFPEWGNEFLTLVIAVIVLNQLIGPPLFKWSINIVGDSHTKAKHQDGDGFLSQVFTYAEIHTQILRFRREKPGDLGLKKWQGVCKKQSPLVGACFIRV